jgi:hypothetical protein
MSIELPKEAQQQALASIAHDLQANMGARKDK